MDINKIRIITLKEWEEVFKNKLVFFTVIFLPLVLAALPLIVFWTTNRFDAAEFTGSNGGDLPAGFLEELCSGLGEADCVMIYMGNLFTTMFMILPMIIPVTIAAYSIVGEKTARSLEPLLATPITTLELIIGKAIAAVVPAIAATWFAFGVYLGGAFFMVNRPVFAELVAPQWLVAIGLVGPLLALLGVALAIIISSRVSDPRVAEQLAGLVVLPLMMVVIGQSVGWLLIDQTMVYIMGVVVIVLDAVLFYFAVQVFEREHILTRWK